MIKFSEILKRNAISKVELARRMGIDQSNVNRTLNKFNKNLSEIDNFLKSLNTSLKEELGCGETNSDKVDLCEKENYLNIPKEIVDILRNQSETIRSQQRTIDAFSTAQRKSKSA